MLDCMKKFEEKPDNEDAKHNDKQSGSGGVISVDTGDKASGGGSEKGNSSDRQVNEMTDEHVAANNLGTENAGAAVGFIDSKVDRQDEELTEEQCLALMSDDANTTSDKEFITKSTAEASGSNGNDSNEIHDLTADNSTSGEASEKRNIAKKAQGEKENQNDQKQCQVQADSRAYANITTALQGNIKRQLFPRK